MPQLIYAKKLNFCMNNLLNAVLNGGPEVEVSI